MQVRIAIFSIDNAGAVECVAGKGTVVIFTPARYRRNPEAKRNNVTDKFRNIYVCVCYVERHCVFKRFAYSIRESVYFSLRKCKDPLANRFDDLTADRCKTGIGYRAPRVHGITSVCGSAHADARLGILGRGASGNCGFSFKAAAEPAAS